MNTEQAMIEIGKRIQRYRLNQNLSQQQIANRAGIGIASVVRLEAGKGATLAHFISVLTALGRLDSLDTFLPVPLVSPIQMAKLMGKVRRRASRKS